MKKTQKILLSSIGLLGLAAAFIPIKRIDADGGKTYSALAYKFIKKHSGENHNYFELSLFLFNFIDLT